MSNSHPGKGKGPDFNQHPNLRPGQSSGTNTAAVPPPAQRHSNLSMPTETQSGAFIYPYPPNRGGSDAVRYLAESVDQNNPHLQGVHTRTTSYGG